MKWISPSSSNKTVSTENSLRRRKNSKHDETRYPKRFPNSKRKKKEANSGRTVFRHIVPETTKVDDNRYKEIRHDRKILQ